MEYVLSAKNNLPRLPTFSHFHLLTTNSASLILKGFNDLYLVAKDLEKLWNKFSDEQEYSATGTTVPTVSSISPTKNQSVFLITDNITLLLG